MLNNAKISWNTQKTPTKHVLSLFEKFLKIRFLAEKSGSRLKCRIMLKYLETLRKHQLNMFWGFLRNFWKSGSRLKHRVLGSDVKQYWKYLETPRKQQLNMFWGFLRIYENPVVGSKIRFSAQMSNKAKKYFETPRKHQLNTLWGILRNFWKSDSWLKNPVLGSDIV